MKNYLIILLAFLKASCQATQTPVEPKQQEGVTLRTKSKSPADILALFPATLDGRQRHVIALNTAETGQVIEILPGKTIMVDCNKHGLQGSISQKYYQNYPYIDFNSTGDVYSTKMGCPDDKRTEAFVTGEMVELSTDSRMPVVVYVPEGIEIRYRVKGDTDWKKVN